MTHSARPTRRHFMQGAAALSSTGLAGWALPALAETGAAFMQAVAESAAGDKALSAFYRDNGYRPIWTGRSDRRRRQALLQALEGAADHGLPAGAYETGPLRARLRAARSARDLGRIEVGLSRLLLDYARHVQSGVLEPRAVDREIDRRRPLRDGAELLAGFAASSPAAFLRRLAPQTPEYQRLKRTIQELRQRLANLDVELEVLKAERRADEWRIRSKLADAMGAIAGLSASDAHVEGGAHDIAVDAATGEIMTW